MAVRDRSQAFFDLMGGEDVRPARRVAQGSQSYADLLAEVRLLFAYQDGDAYAGIGSRKTPADVCEDMTLIAGGLEALGFTLRSGFAGGADTAFELGTTLDDLRQIFAPWQGFGANPNSKWDRPRWDQIRAWEAKTGRRFRPAKATLLGGDVIAQAETLAAQYHRNWVNLSDGERKLHSRNMGQALGPRLDRPAKFVIAWTVDGGPTGGTGQALRVAAGYGIRVLNLQIPDHRRAVLEALGL